MPNTPYTDRLREEFRKLQEITLDYGGLGTQKSYLLNEQQHNHISDWFISQFSLLLEELAKEVEAEKKPEVVIEDCENCGEVGYGKVWYGRGAPNDPHGYGDAYYPTGSAVFCEQCFKEHSIGNSWNGEEIWKCSSTQPEYDELRMGHIKKTVKENVGINEGISLAADRIRARVGK